jgi:2-aminomuconate deaminase
VNGAIPAEFNDIQDQAAIVMDHLQSVLNEADHSFSDTVHATLYLSDIANYGGFNEVYGTFWGEGGMPPSRASIAVRDIPGALVLVKVSMIA